MPDQEEELGPTLADAFQTMADGVRELRDRGLAAEARRRVRRRRQAVFGGSAAMVVAVAIGGVWSAIGDGSPVDTATSGSAADSSAGRENPESSPGGSCAEQHPILSGDLAPSPSAGLDLETPVSGLLACRYRLTPGATTLLGAGVFDATTAQRVVDAIKVLPERNPDLPVFKCTPERARPTEAIVLRFDTRQGPREVWVQYDGCATAGFLTGTRTYGLYAAPLQLFLTGSLRPTGGVYLDHLKGW
ncbi:hypothetical protein Kfla_6095 [Kribbella flavida DSM 17836]|uniref:Uncharacterized protein n=1 Tax=Kribbella flavida (strain DSM 17836 / JCM 10339 / NBRC 14399) TaxID=479435 RepID=D2PU47_KRIFD|nr:hypothetical protein [Kribbella flavida]ADB35098.1 hypothetical protein Kfla_6095 [Kribbella flavida DSM 17836]